MIEDFGCFLCCRHNAQLVSKYKYSRAYLCDDQCKIVFDTKYDLKRHEVDSNVMVNSLSNLKKDKLLHWRKIIEICCSL